MIPFCRKLMTEPLGGPVVSLEALRKHRHLPAAAALMSVLLYTALVTSHIVSQATHRALPAQDADIQTVVAGDAGCHDLPSSAGNGHHPSGGHPFLRRKNAHSAQGMPPCTSPSSAAPSLSCRSRLSPNALQASAPPSRSAQPIIRPGTPALPRHSANQQLHTRSKAKRCQAP